MSTPPTSTVPTPRDVPPITLQFQRTPFVLRCDAPNNSSDGGVLLLRQVDDRIGLTQAFEALLEDHRHPERRRHDRREQFRQRVYQIALGYEDCNDADLLRHDPAVRYACGSDDELLSSQSTLTRWENGVTGRELNRLWRELERQYVDELDPATAFVVLDIDGTDDPTHGSQQLSLFHGFYDQHMFHPLVVFDGERAQLVSALLRRSDDAEADHPRNQAALPQRCDRRAR